ncbi:hypothetical protein NQ315_015458 [Exocentrus adspersus]|uniref:Uncharacterized protein n=1 Tax=Exocentrus adspersus TaxID=1586481 RepID=A0AAV8VMD8_9CUCU|nr:hypothetical protein NQ315_015458 [Exocentrus adspersus]
MRADNEEFIGGTSDFRACNGLIKGRLESSTPFLGIHTVTQIIWDTNRMTLLLLQVQSKKR